MLSKPIIVGTLLIFTFSSLEVSRETRSTAVFFLLNTPRPEFCRYVIYVKDVKKMTKFAFNNKKIVLANFLPQDTFM